MPAKDLLDQRLDFKFLHAMTHRLHGFAVRFSGNVCSALHQFNLFGTLEHSHLMNDRCRIDDRLRRMNGFSIHRAHASNLPNDRIVEIEPEAKASDQRSSGEAHPRTPRSTSAT